MGFDSSLLVPHHNPNIKQIQLALPLKYRMNFSRFSISFTTTLRMAGLPTGPCSTFLSSCSLSLDTANGSMFKKEKKKKIILLSTLTFSADFCFDSESHLSSYQGIKIITSFGPSSFLSMTWVTILLLHQSLFYFPDDLCLFFLLQNLGVCFSLCLECSSFLHIFVWPDP